MKELVSVFKDAIYNTIKSYPDGIHAGTLMEVLCKSAMPIDVYLMFMEELLIENRVTRIENVFRAVV